jgi:hypothetical protein
MTQRGQKLLIAEDGTRQVTTLAPAAELQKRIKPGDWNQCTIIARGPEIILKINGAVMSHVIDREKGKGADFVTAPPRTADESAVQEYPHQVSQVDLTN